MTEEMIKECKNCDALGIDSEIGVYYCCLSHRQDDLPKEFTCNDFTPNKQLKRLEQENKELKEQRDKYYQQTLDDEITISDLIEEIQTLKSDRTLERISKLSIENARLEQENKKLKSQNENIINEYNRIQNEIIGDIEFREVMLSGITPLKVLQNIKQRNKELQAFYDVYECFKNDFDTNKEKLNTYRSALEEIRELAKCRIENLVILEKCNEVLE